MVDELGGGIGVELGLGEDIGVADGHGAGGHGGEAGAGAVAGAGDDAVGVLVHELLGRSLDEGLEGGGAVVGDLAHDARGGIGGTSGRGLRATAASQAETGHGGDTAGKAEEGATRAGIIEHGSPFESNIGVISRRTEKLGSIFIPMRRVRAPSVVRQARYRALAAHLPSFAVSYGTLTEHYHVL